MTLILKQLEFVIYVKSKKNRDFFFKTGGLCIDCFSEKISCPTSKILLNRPSLGKHRRKRHNNQTPNSING